MTATRPPTIASMADKFKTNNPIAANATHIRTALIGADGTKLSCRPAIRPISVLLVVMLMPSTTGDNPGCCSLVHIAFKRRDVQSYPFGIIASIVYGD